MTTFAQLSFWLFFIAFFFAVFFAFYIPGSFFLRRFSLTSFQKSILAIIVGMSLWGWQGFVFGFAHIRWMSYLYLLLFFILWLRTDEWKKILQFIKKYKSNQSIDFLLVILVTVGTLLQLTSAFFIGIVTTTGMFFCCTPPDSLYHIALTNQLIKQFPPTEPGMAGIIVHNYHYMSNLVAADLIRIFQLPLIATQFQYFVVLLSLLLGLSAIVFGQLVKMKKNYIRWLVFFLYFSGDLTFLLTFLTGKGFDFNTPFMENALWLWVSPPRVFAVVVFSAGASLLLLWIKNRKFLTGLLMAFVFASLVSFKIYEGIFMAGGVIGLCIYFLFKKNFRMLLPLLLTGILSLALYLPVNSQSGGFVFTGFWQFENFIVQPHLSLTHLEMAREIYLAHHNWFGVARFELLFIVCYLIFVFGTIILGVFQTKKSLSLFPKELNIFLLSGITLCAILGFFFIQTSGGANSIQFLITIDILFSIYAALACYYWIAKIKNKLKYVVIFSIVLLTIPRVIDIEHVYLAKLYNNPTLVIDNNQLQALSYINTYTPSNAVILVDNLNNLQTYAYDKKIGIHYLVETNDTRIWIGNFSYYVSFLANRPLFIDGDIDTASIVLSHGVNTSERIKVERAVFLDKNPAVVKELLHKNNISYIYVGSATNFVKNLPPFLQIVYANSEVSVLKVL